MAYNAENVPGIVPMISGNAVIEHPTSSLCVCDEDSRPEPTCDCYDPGPATDDGPDE